MVDKHMKYRKGITFMSAGADKSMNHREGVTFMSAGADKYMKGVEVFPEDV